MALLATMGLFAVAFLAMRTVRILPFLSPSRQITVPTMVYFTPPAPEPVRPTRPTARRIAPTATVTVPPVAVPTTIAPVDPIVTVSPVPIPAAPARDSATGGGADAPKRAITDLISTREIPTFAPSARRTSPAPIAPAGVTASRSTLSVAQRDSIATVKMKAIAAMVAAGLAREPTAAEKRELAGQVEPGRALPGTRAAGDAPLMNGGANVRVPLGSFTLPLFTRSPSPIETPEQRALRLRLTDRALFLRDSLRADSIAKANIRP